MSKPPQADKMIPTSFNALFNMLIAAFSSLSKTIPHLVQE